MYICQAQAALIIVAVTAATSHNTSFIIITWWIMKLLMDAPQGYCGRGIKLMYYSLQLLGNFLNVTATHESRKVHCIVA
jgi:hypothetical protein